MRLLFIADGRSPIALNWIGHFIEKDHDVHLLSTFPCNPNLDLASIAFVSVAFSGARRWVGSPGRRAVGGAKAIRLRSALRHWLGPMTIPIAARSAQCVIEAIEPDLVHAMRIPYEGMLASAVVTPIPLALSIWGNDFTLHASSTPAMARSTRHTLARADALHTDCHRDLQLAYRWGFSEDRPTIVLPGGGGVRTEVFRWGDPDLSKLNPSLTSIFDDIPSGAQVVVNPRGFRAYVRNDTFFQAIPEVLRTYPTAVFLCPAMVGETQAIRWIEQLGIAKAVRLLPTVTSEEMATIFQRASISVSVTEHDGTPNTLLEAMACGCFPIAGDLASIREWIEVGVNGLLVDPNDPIALANAVSNALGDTDLRDRAASHNLKLIDERATHEGVMMAAEELYRTIVQ
jgi:glycosyltransferase involved in cell wall biosynthesis